MIEVSITILKTRCGTRAPSNFYFRKLLWCSRDVCVEGEGGFWSRALQPWETVITSWHLAKIEMTCLWELSTSFSKYLVCFLPSSWSWTPKILYTSEGSSRNGDGKPDRCNGFVSGWGSGFIMMEGMLLGILWQRKRSQLRAFTIYDYTNTHFPTPPPPLGMCEHYIAIVFVGGGLEICGVLGGVHVPQAPFTTSLFLEQSCPPGAMTLSWKLFDYYYC